jgi:hypothetical protein
MTTPQLIAILAQLAVESQELAARELIPDEHIAAGYERLRARASRLNEQHGWMTAEELAVELPTLAGLAEIRRLEGSLDPSFARATEPDIGQLAVALRNLAGWATGLRLACETLEQM